MMLDFIYIAKMLEYVFPSKSTGVSFVYINKNDYPYIVR